MNTLIREVDALAAEMDALEKFNDDVFIQFFEKEEALQERLSEAEKAGKLIIQYIEETAWHQPGCSHSSVFNIHYSLNGHSVF